MQGQAGGQAIYDKRGNRVHANLFCESLQILLLLGHFCATEGCQQPHIIKRMFAPHLCVCLYVIMQIINVIVRHYAHNKNDAYKIFFKEPIHFPDFASSFLVRLCTAMVAI